MAHQASQAKRKKMKIIIGTFLIGIAFLILLSQPTPEKVEVPDINEAWIEIPYEAMVPVAICFLIIGVVFIMATVRMPRGGIKNVKCL